MRPDPRKLILFLVILSLVAGLAGQTFRFSASPAELKAGERGSISVRLNIPDGLHQSYDPTFNEFFKLSATHPDFSFGETSYPTAGAKVISDTQWDYHGSVTLRLPFTVKASAAAGAKTVSVSLEYGLCYDGGACLPPETETRSVSITVLAPSAAIAEETEAAADEELEAEEPVLEEAAAEAPVETAMPQAPAESRGVKTVLWYLLLAFLGGVIMNFTPCVLPVLTIRAMSIVNQAHEDRSQIFRHSMAYALGVLVSFIALAIVFIVLKLAGESVGWGFQFQSISFTIALTALIFVFALALLDVFLISPPGMTAATKVTAKKGVSGSFFGGIFAFLLATPCSAPLLGTAVGFAFGLPAWLMLIFFALVGIGLAFPFILIGLTPKALKVIPKPGEWMNIFKEVMAFVLLWIVYTMLKSVLKLADGDYLLNVIFFMLALGFASWMYGRFVRPEHSRLTQWIFTLLTLGVIVGSAFWLLPYEPAPVSDIVYGEGELRPAHGTPEGWYDFDPVLVQELIDDGKIVFVDFGAVWCKNCQTNEKTVLWTNDIMQAFKSSEVTLIHGDYTRQNPGMLDWMKRHGRVGVPFNALYAPGKETRIFPELLTKRMILDALAEIKE